MMLTASFLMAVALGADLSGALAAAQAGTENTDGPKFEVGSSAKRLSRSHYLAAQTQGQC